MASYSQNDEFPRETVDRVLDALIKQARTNFVTRADKWLEQVKAGKEMRL